MNENINSVLISECEARNWGPERLAAQLTVAGCQTSVMTTRAWYRGDYEPSMEKARGLAKILGKKHDELFPIPN